MFVVPTGGAARIGAAAGLVGFAFDMALEKRASMNGERE